MDGGWSTLSIDDWRYGVDLPLLLLFGSQRLYWVSWSAWDPLVRTRPPWRLLLSHRLVYHRWQSNISCFWLHLSWFTPRSSAGLSARRASSERDGAPVWHHHTSLVSEEHPSKSVFLQPYHIISYTRRMPSVQIAKSNDNGQHPKLKKYKYKHTLRKSPYFVSLVFLLIATVLTILNTYVS